MGWCLVLFTVIQNLFKTHTSSVITKNNVDVQQKITYVRRNTFVWPPSFGLRRNCQVHSAWMVGNILPAVHACTAVVAYPEPRRRRALVICRLHLRNTYVLSGRNDAIPKKNTSHSSVEIFSVSASRRSTYTAAEQRRPRRLVQCRRHQETPSCAKRVKCAPMRKKNRRFKPAA